MSELKECPCGETPTDLDITDNGQGGKYAMVCGDCCGGWEIEFRTNYTNIDSEECKGLAVSAWNATPRGSEKLKARIAELQQQAVIEGATIRQMSDLIVSLNERIERLEAAQRWIPVSERLPFEGELLLIFPDLSGNINVAIYDSQNFVTESDHAFPSHWMPSPYEPKDSVTMNDQAGGE